MDEIEINGLEISACHGVLDFEKVKKQKFIIDARLYLDLYAALDDDINSTVNYAKACDVLEETVLQNSFNLIEKLAYECCFALMKRFKKVKRIELTCRKPEAPLTQKFESVGVRVSLERVKAYLSLGSSIGDREATMKKAIALLSKLRATSVEKVSAFYETEPYGGVAKNMFLNCALEIETCLPPHALLDEIHRIEEALGRTRTVRWEDRTLDIDIIFYGDKEICDGTLTVPHRDYKNRDFVLIPLKEIAPHLF